MTLLGAARALLRRWWIPLLIAVIAVAAVFVITPKAKAAQVQYTAKSILIVNPSSNQSSSVNLQEAALEVTVGTVPATAATALHYTGNPAALASRVTATSDATVGTLTLQVSGTDGAAAAAISNEFASALNAYLLQSAVSSYQSQVANVQARLKSLQSDIDLYLGQTDPISKAKLGAAEDQYRLSYDQFQQLAAQGQPVAPFNVLQKAVPVASGGVRPPVGRTERSVIGGLVGLLIGIAVALGVDVIWPRINDRSDAEREFGTIVLAEVPKLRRRDRRPERRHRPVGRELASFREAYRMLRTSILLMGSSEGANTGESGSADQMLLAGPQVILVSSPLPSEGKSTTVANLAVSMAETGRRVLVCNADFRAPQVHRAFGLQPGPGLTDLLSGDEGSRHLADMVHQTDVPGVLFVHSGSQVDDAAELIARRGAQLLEEARALADVVLLDTAPLLVVSDASELLSAVDAVVMVARAGQTSRDSARRSYELLARADIPVLGVVLVGAKGPISYYYSGRYGAPVGGWRSWLERRRRGRGVLAVEAKRRRPPSTRDRADLPRPERIAEASNGSSTTSSPVSVPALANGQADARHNGRPADLLSAERAGPDD